MRVELCEECGGEIRIGDYPFCKGDPSRHARPLNRYIPFSPRIDPNISPNGPVEITSLRQWDRVLKENNLEVSSVEDRERAAASREREDAVATDAAFERSWGEACKEVLGGDMGTAQVTE
jgi:hypothetical protein